jgi:flagellar motility protein MotE (MotC chaperone)
VREKIIYIVSFLLAFVLVSGMIIYLNSMYSNIFAFEFVPINSQSNITEEKPANSAQNSLPNPNVQVNPISSLQQDTSKKNVDSSKIKTVSITPSDTAAIAKVQHSIDEQKKRDIERNFQLREDSLKLIAESKLNAKKDSVYQIWVRKTVKLYESMDSRKAAKIILGYSDNIARDLLLTMKKKKAADIIAEFKPEVATRIISANR